MDITVEKIVKVVTAHILIILICALAFAGFAFGYSKQIARPAYTASMKSILISESGIQSYSDITTLRRMVNTFVEFLDSRDFFTMLKRNIDFEYSDTELKNMTTFTMFETSEAFIVTVKAPDDKTCRKLIHGIQDHAMEYVAQKYNKVEIYTVESPSEPKYVAVPIVRNMIVGFLLGLFLSALILILYFSWDTHIKSEDDLLTNFGYPMLGTVPDFNLKKRGKELKRRQD